MNSRYKTIVIDEQTSIYCGVGNIIVNLKKDKNVFIEYIDNEGQVWYCRAKTSGRMVGKKFTVLVLDSG